MLYQIKIYNKECGIYADSHDEAFYTWLDYIACLDQYDHGREVLVTDTLNTTCKYTVRVQTQVCGRRA